MRWALVCDWRRTGGNWDTVSYARRETKSGARNFLNRAEMGAACDAGRKGRSRAPEHDGESHIVGSELREGVRSGLFEASEAAAEYEADLVGGAGALPGDLDFRLIAFFGRSRHLRAVRAMNV